MLLQYFRLELMYVDQLRRREEVLTGGAAAPAPPADENRDAVMEGAVAATVFDFAAERFPGDAAFLASVLAVALEFEFAGAVRKHVET